MSSIDLSPGALFAGQFRIVRPLAKGGMGAVYVVEQVSTGRERALKLMHPMLVSDAKSIERFQREAQVGSQIESDHIVEVIAAGVEAAGPTPWMCMELLRGETLADRVDKRGVPGREELLEIVKQLAHALGAAHRAGIVHRDLKPENIFLAESRRDGVPFTLKVLDFGVAALTQGGAGDVGGPRTTQGVGSPLWMAPEQTNVGKVVLATDVWALGLIAFYLLTGQSYWRTARTPGSTITALLVEIMVEELSPASVRAREVAPGAILPAGFDGWFARCLVRDPAARMTDAVVATSSLLPILADSGGTLPEAFLATAAVPGLAGSGTQPGAGSHASGPPPAVPASTAPISVFADTHAGPQLASGPQAVPPPWQGPGAFAPPQLPASEASSGAVRRDVPTVPAARGRRPWVWALFGLVGLGGLCAFGIVYQVIEGGRQLAAGLAQQSDVIDGRLVDPESGAAVEIGPDGVRLTVPENRSTVAIGSGGVEVRGDTPRGGNAAPEPAEAGASIAAIPSDPTDAAETATQTATAAESGSETATAVESETETVTPVDVHPERPRAPRSHGVRLPRANVTPEQQAAFDFRVVRMCRTNLEGQPRTRFAVTIGSGIQVVPLETEAQNWFARCVRVNAGESRQASGTYVFFAP